MMRKSLVTELRRHGWTDRHRPILGANAGVVDWNHPSIGEALNFSEDQAVALQKAMVPHPTTKAYDQFSQKYLEVLDGMKALVARVEALENAKPPDRFNNMREPYLHPDSCPRCGGTGVVNQYCSNEKGCPRCGGRGLL